MDENIKVAGRRVAHPGFALARDANAGALVDARRYLDREVAALERAAFAVAGGAGIGNRLARALASRAAAFDDEEALLRAHDFTWIDVIAPHEAYPGHHLQALKAQENPRPMRQVYSTPVFTEGWGLYTEELMHGTGFYADPEATRLTQLRLRLWRAARVLLDAQLHTGEIDYDQARDFLAKNIGMEQGATAGEVGIYVSRPSYAIGYVVGYYEIMQLREDYRRAKGDAWDAREFHDRLLTLGSLPMPQVRRLLGLEAANKSSP